eukprot:scpid105459/ scgid16497/ 
MAANVKREHTSTSTTSTCTTTSVKIEAGDVNIKILAPNGDKVSFRIKRTLKFAEVQQLFCKKQGYSSNVLRLHFAGDRLHGSQCLNDLELDEDDDPDNIEMELFPYSDGGCGRA